MLSVKIFNKNKLAVKLLLFMLILGILIYVFSISLVYLNKIGYLLKINPVIVNSFDSIAVIETNLLKSHINSALPIIELTTNGVIKDNYDSALDWIISYAANFDIKRPETIIASEIALVNAYEAIAVNSSLNVKENITLKENIESIDDTSEDIKESINKSNNEKVTVDKIVEKEFSYPSNRYINNETEFNINTPKLLEDKLSIKLNKSSLTKDPTILIIHTHTSEAYTPTENFYYVPSDPDRTEKPEYNVVRVGQELAKELDALGIKVIHDKTVHDYPSYRGSYNNSLKTAQALLAKYPSIKFVFDIHRDAFVSEDGSKMKVVTQIDNKKVAQIMFVVGTNSSGLEHPYWRENLKLALKLQNKIYKDTPGLARLINLTKYRYNQHTTTGSLIVEVGSNGNTLDEALLSCKYLAKSIKEVIHENIK